MHNALAIMPTLNTPAQSMQRLANGSTCRILAFLLV